MARELTQGCQKDGDRLVETTFEKAGHADAEELGRVRIKRAEAEARAALAGRKSGSQRTLRWREPNSNHRSRSCERLFWALPIGDGGTKGGATYRFRSETAMLAWSGYP
jgi:hypothetical protein